VKGAIERHDDGEPTDRLQALDVFDARGVVAGAVSSRFVAVEDTLAYAIPRATILDLVAANARFSAALFADVSTRLAEQLDRDGRRELHALALTRVDHAFLRPAHVVDGALDVAAVVRLFDALRTKVVLVRDGDALGIFTVADLPRAILDGRPLATLPVAAFASRPLVSVRPSATLGEALAAMIHYAVQRVVVRDGDDVRGVLHGLDLFSFLSNQSYLLGLQLAEAPSLEALARLAPDVERLVERLYEGGQRPQAVMRLKHVLDVKLLARTWALVAPPDVQAQTCLYVMGSEGRAEQGLRTDQDDGLVVDDALADDPRVEAAATAFVAALRACGVPDCPGGVMVTNPAWREGSRALSARIERWVSRPDGADLIAAASFVDARVVDGDAGLLARAKDLLFTRARGEDAFLRRFAAPLERFGPRRGWWGRAWADASGALELKKTAIFPLVHGARTLALERGLRETSTVERLERLADDGVIDAGLARELVDAAQVFAGLRLRVELDARRAGHPPPSTVALDALGRLDRELLRDTLDVVARFRGVLAARYHLELA
jgi:CBS domain-containing protein